ncbi:MAG: carboxypeptidase regulatory-like domain-containing protein [Armatimonadota bacterium]|nr:carboxypeptidase regulatory-like domain-containing protein [bacterium]MDW8321406.1 carboxypeptidase regulatory-like domain-containing protein [Armatimonadota bacterium]
MRLRALLAVVVLLCSTLAAFAQIQVGANAVNNATIQPAGPRTGVNGKRFFNIEGNNFGNFASFGVVDFNAADFGLLRPIVDIVGITLKLYDAPAAFSANGRVRFWLSEDTTTDIEPGTSPLRWNATALPDGVGTQLAPLHLLGEGTYTKGTAGDLFTYSLSLPAGAKPYLLSRINSASRIRLVVTPAEDTVAATYAGYNHATIPPPRLELTLIPRPATFNIRGNVQLGDFGGDVTQVPITVQLRQDGAPVRTETLYTDSSGNYTLANVSPGTYDVAFKASHWLRVVVSGVVIHDADVTGVNVALTNGDIDGDNEVTLFDFGALVAAFGSVPGDDNWNADADLDGDEDITLFDFGILVRNFGAIGDE